MESQVSRGQFMASFAPIVPTLEEVIAEARAASDFKKIAVAIPEITRRSGISRVSGTARWILAADGLVDRVPSFPDGFVLHSSEANHNQGKYIFGFPLGVFTFKREAHDAEEGAYLQETLEILQETPALTGAGVIAGLKVYISVPSKGAARLIVKQPNAEEPIEVLLDEFARPGKVVAQPKSSVPTSTVNSTNVPRSDGEVGADEQ
jgi:hypothetical protein